MNLLMATIIGAACLASGAVAAPPGGDPNYIRPIPAELMTRYYPSRASKLNVEGDAQLQCRVEASGELSACRVMGETPGDYGFGQSALQLSRELRVRTEQFYRRGFDYREIGIPVQFRRPILDPSKTSVAFAN